MNDSRLGQRLRQIRLEHGMSQADLARRLAISPAYLNLIEKGRRKVKLPLLLQAKNTRAQLDAVTAKLAGEAEPGRHLLDRPRRLRRPQRP